MELGINQARHFQKEVMLSQDPCGQLIRKPLMPNVDLRTHSRLVLAWSAVGSLAVAFDN